MKIGERIRAERRRLKLSQDEVAAALETTKQAIYKYEKGIVENIPPEKVERMAELFGVTPAYLIGWTDHIDSAAAAILEHTKHLTREHMLAEIQRQYR